MKETAEKDGHEKKPYVKPLVIRVDLTPEEVVMGSCKASSGPAGSKSPLFPCKVCGLALGS